MEKEIKVVFIKNKPLSLKEILFKSFPFPRVISSNPSWERDSCCTVGFMMMRNYYQKLERFQLRDASHRPKKNELVALVINGETINVQKSNYSFAQLFSIFTHILERKQLDCIYCSKKLSFEEVSLDHFFPRSSGGEDTTENFKVSCFPCNSLKSSIHPVHNEKLFKIFWEFVQARPSWTHREFFSYLFSSKEFSQEDYGLVLEKLSLPLSMRIELALEMQKRNIPFSINKGFNLETIKKLELAPELLRKLKQIEQFSNTFFKVDS